MIVRHMRSFFPGTVSFIASDGFAERFIAYCAAEKIELKNLTAARAELSAQAKISDMPGINAAASKSGMTVTVIKESGAFPLLRRLKRNFGIPLGLLAGILLFAFLSSLIWTVEITGNKTDDRDELGRILRECGIYRGAFLCNADREKAERMLESSGNHIYEAAVDIIGSRVFVDIVENAVPEKIRDNKAHSNIIASQDGTIVKADVFAGVAAVKPGDMVCKGDTLVVGRAELPGGGICFYDSEACIKAKTEHTVTCSAAAKPYLASLSSIRDRFSFYVFGLCLLPAIDGENTAVTQTERLIKSSGTVLPIGIIRQRQTVFEYKTVDIAPDICTLIALHDLARAALPLIADSESTERKIRKLGEAPVTFEAVFTCLEEIGEKADYVTFSEE